jgi:hypothetical protein
MQERSRIGEQPMARKTMLVLLVLNTFFTISAVVFAFLDHIGWRIGAFYGNMEHIDRGRLAQIIESVESLFYQVMVPVIATSATWIILSWWLFVASRRSTQS